MVVSLLSLIKLLGLLEAGISLIWAAVLWRFARERKEFKKLLAIRNCPKCFAVVHNCQSCGAHVPGYTPYTEKLLTVESVTIEIDGIPGIDSTLRP